MMKIEFQERCRNQPEKYKAAHLEDDLHLSKRDGITWERIAAE
jgi:hypothetical protein